jgi:hypothetical protein
LIVSAIALQGNRYEILELYVTSLLPTYVFLFAVAVVICRGKEFGIQAFTLDKLVWAAERCTIQLLHLFVLGKEVLERNMLCMNVRTH